jgi:hypothetical protein
MGFAAMLVHAAHAPFEDREVAFQSVRVRRVAGIFLDGMVNRLMLLELPALET